MSTVPLTPSTKRTRWGWSSRTGMQSVTRTVPVRVELGLEHEGVGAVPAPGGQRWSLGPAGRGELPEAVGPRRRGGGRSTTASRSGAGTASRSEPSHADQGGGVQVADDGVVLDALAHGLILAGHPEMHGPVLTAVRRVVSACLHPGEHPGEVRRSPRWDRRSNGEDDPDDLASGPDQRSARVAREHVGVERVDAPGHRAVVVDVLSDGGDLLGHAGRPDGQSRRPRDSPRMAAWVPGRRRRG